jgi:hypothetical protein
MGEGVSIYAEMLNTNCESVMDWTTSYHIKEITSAKYYEKKNYFPVKHKQELQ